MKYLTVFLLLAGGFVALSTIDAGAVVCARGVYRAGCVGPRGAVVVGAARVRHAVVVAPRGPYRTVTLPSGCLERVT